MSYHHPRTAFVLDRKQARRRVKMMRSRRRCPLSKTVDHGLEALRRIHGDETDTYTAELLRSSLRDLLSAVDSADVLLEGGAAGAARAIGRTCIEQGASILYAIQRNDERIAAAKILTDFESMETSLKEIHKHLEPAGYDELADAFRVQRIQLEHADYPMLEAAKELRALAEAGHVSWYATFGGPRGVKELLDTVGFPGLYGRYYQPWSAHVHGSLNSSTASSSRVYRTRPLRFYSPEDHDSIVTFLGIWCEVVTMTTAGYFFASQRGSAHLAEGVELLKAMPGDPVYWAWDNEADLEASWG